MKDIKQHIVVSYKYDTDNGFRWIPILSFLVQFVPTKGWMYSWITAIH